MEVSVSRHRFRGQCPRLHAQRQGRQAILSKLLKSSWTIIPGVINVDKNPAYPAALKYLKADEVLPKETELRPVKYLNNLIEQDHRFIKRRSNPGIGVGSFNTSQRTIQGY
jgi:transposase, IS6 family